MRISLLAFTCAALVLGALAAHAEKADREKEIVVNADRLVADDAKKTSAFEGNVIVTQGTMRMTAEKVTVREDAQRHKFYVATGSPVTFRQKLDKTESQKADNTEEWVEGFAQRAEFDDLNDVLHLHDKAVVKRNQNEITGDFISYDMRRELAEVTGAQSGGAAPNRVKAVILPPPKKPDEKARPAAGASGSSAPASSSSPATPASSAPAPSAANPPLELKRDPGRS